MRTASTLALLILIGNCARAQSSAPQDSVSAPEVKSTPAATLASAQLKLEHGNAAEAIAMLEQLASSEGKTVKGIQHELGLAYYRTGRLIPAEQAFARAMDEDSTDLESVQMRGLSLYRLGRPADAIPFLERVRQWTPNANADANYVLGLCYLNAQRFEQARLSFASQFSVPPDSAAAYLLLGKMLMQANLPEAAAEAAKKALQAAPRLPLAHFLLGEFYLFKSDTAQALKEFDQEREISPTNPAIYDRLGDLYTRMGQFQSAQEALAKAISLDTSSTGPFIQMGKVLLRRNDPATSLLYLQHAAKMDPANYITHTLLSQAYRGLGREDEAKKEIDIASKIHASEQLKLQPVQ
jgi:tetratricopeptide (TPR) repeat protein